MFFNSYVFVLGFLPIAVIGYFLCNKFVGDKGGKVFLLFMSIVFSAFLTLYNTVSIIVSSLFNYTIYRLLRTPGASLQVKKVFLITGILVNVLNLFYLKYFNFFITNLNGIFSTALPIVRIALPIGISFYTFQQIMFIVEAYRGETESYTPLDYFLYIFYFPKLVQGPISNHGELIRQFNDPGRKGIDFNNFSRGLVSFSIGLAKKVLIADSLGRVVDWGYLNVSTIGTFDTVFIILFYTMQIYFDFSGYCDMASGISLLLNIKLPVNFNSPYKAVSVSDFWKRWHMTLTGFFTRYVYIPLGGSRKGGTRTRLNILMIFILSGLWHGANWTFVLWGALHGIAMVVDRIMDVRKMRLPKVLSWLLTFGFVNITWVVFRSDSLGTVMQVFRNLLRMDGRPVSEMVRETFYFPEFKLVHTVLRNIPLINQYFMPALFTIFLCVILAIVFHGKNTDEQTKDFKPTLMRALFISFLLIWSISSLANVTSFLYTNF